MVSLVITLLLAAPSDAVDRATARFDAGDFQGALNVLETALNADLPTTEVANVQLARARCFMALRRPTDFDQALTAALEADPLLPDSGSPSFRASLQQARVRLAGLVTISSEPAGGGVRIDGVVVGKTPLSQRVPVGAHVVEILDGGGAVVATRSLTIAPREKQGIILSVAPPKSDDSVVRQPPPPLEKRDVPFDLGWPVAPTATGRFTARLLCAGCSSLGFSGGLGLGVVARWWVAEVELIIARPVGLGVRGGLRVPLGDRFSFHVTLDGALFFDRLAAPGLGTSVGGTFSLGRFVELLVELSGRKLFGISEPVSWYGLASFGVRVRLPSSAVP